MTTMALQPTTTTNIADRLKACVAEMANVKERLPDGYKWYADHLPSSLKIMESSLARLYRIGEDELGRLNQTIQRAEDERDKARDAYLAALRDLETENLAIAGAYSALESAEKALGKATRDLNAAKRDKKARTQDIATLQGNAASNAAHIVRALGHLRELNELRMTRSGLELQIKIARRNDERGASPAEDGPDGQFVIDLFSSPSSLA